MSYIGVTPAEAYASFYVQHFTTSATTSYALDYPVVNENDLRLVINNVVQQPGSGKAYTAAASTLTLSAATTTSDAMYTVFLGRALQTVNPPADSVGGSQLADSAISGQTALGAEPADTDEFLVSDAGTLKRMDYSYIKSAGGILQVKQTVVTDEVSQAGSSGSYVDLSEMAVSITPTLSTSKILIYLDAKLFQSQSQWSTIVRLMRDDTAIYVSTDATGNQLQATTGSHNGGVNNPFVTASLFLDAPASTSAISYNMEWSIETSSTAYLNRPNGDVDNNLYWHSASSITAVEIAVGVL